METLTSSFNDDETCMVTLRVWKTFFELHASVPKIRRCSSEPALHFVPDVTRTSGHRNKPELGASRNFDTTQASANPPLMNDDAATSPDPDPAEQTDALRPSDRTVMVRDIPCKVGYKRMMAELKSLGLDGCYDFLFFPKSTRDRHFNRGFCFINFMSPEAVSFFVARFARYQFEGIESRKVARIGRAHVQGRKENMARLIAARNRVEFKANPAGLRAS
eukprot:TRINITY_DN12720_c1_g1_i1.p1 TRINITY_DN12720_c1_g1~~TRINITY_DN12720_c1_g1_i1.p1  ORF type:complete len:219 (+),score=21.51 TRINITY_DN12720_c1_g1_i1:90-746(+)